MDTEFLTGWYIDPSDATRVRYWNGMHWTADTWALADVPDFVAAGPTPPVSIDLDDSDDVDDSIDWSPGHRSAARRRFWRNESGRHHQRS